MSEDMDKEIDKALARRRRLRPWAPHSKAAYIREAVAMKLEREMKEAIDAKAGSDI
jgi:hypothetical protein